MVVLMLDKVVFKTRISMGDKEAHFIMIKGSIQKEDSSPHTMRMILFLFLQRRSLSHRNMGPTQSK